MTDVPASPARTAADVHTELAAAINGFEAKATAAEAANSAAGEAARLVQKLRDELTAMEGDAGSILRKISAFISKHL